MQPNQTQLLAILTNQEKTNLQTIVTNLETVVTNKDTELGLNNQTINELKRELRRQKTFKFLGFFNRLSLLFQQHLYNLDKEIRYRENV